MNKKALFAIPSLDIGGAERQMSILANLLAERGLAPTIVTSVNLESEYVVSDKVQRIRLSGKSRMARIYHLLITLFRFRPDVVLSFIDVSNFVSILYKILRSAGVWVVVSERSHNKDMSVRGKLLFFLYRFADAIASNSRSRQAFIFQKYPHLRDKTVVITNYTSVDKSAVQFKKRKRPLNLAVFARYHPKKTCFFYCAAYRAITNDTIREILR